MLKKIWISGAGRIVLMIRGEKFDKSWFKRKMWKNDDGTAKALDEFEQKNKLWLWEDNEQRLFCQPKGE